MNLGHVSQVRDLERQLVHRSVLLNSARNEAKALRQRAESAEAALENLATSNTGPIVDATGSFYVVWAWVRLVSWALSAACAYWAAFWSPAAVVPVVGAVIHALMVWGVIKIQREG